MEKKLLKDLMNMYFDNISVSDLAHFHDTIIESLDLKRKLEKDELYKIFITLPQYIFWWVIKWDMNDTQVRDDIYEYIYENKDKYKKYQK